MLKTNNSFSIGILILRLALGIIFTMHGWQKFHQWTIAGVEATFTGMGVPGATIAAPAVTILELVGGVLLILGVATRILGVLFAADMVGAVAFAHGPAGFFVTEGGYEFVVILGAAALALAFLGAGIFSVDHSIAGRRRPVKA